MARRLNKRFLIILTLILAGGGAAVLVTAYFLMRKDPVALTALGGQHAAAARKLMATTRPASAAEREELENAERKEWELARDNFALAIRTGRASVNAWIGLGDAMHEMTRFDLRQIGEDLRYWERAREIQPDNPRILRRILDERLAWAELSNRIEPLQDIQKVAEALAKVDKNDLQAQAWQYIAPIRTWLAGAAISDADATKQIEALERVAQQARTQPSTQPAPDPDDPYEFKPFDPSLIQSTLAAAYLQMAQGQRALGDKAKTASWCDKAIAVYDAALRASPRDADLWYRFATVLDAVPRLDQSSAISELVTTPPRICLWRFAIRLTGLKSGPVAMAANCVSPQDTLYPTIQLRLIAEELGSPTRPAPAETVKLAADQMDKLVKDHPDNPDLCLRAADILRRFDPASAAKLVQDPFPPGVRQAGAKAQQMLSDDVKRRLQLVLAWLDEPAAERAKLQAKIDDEFQQLQRVTGTEWDKKPFFLLARAKYVEAFPSSDPKALSTYVDFMKRAIDGLDIAYVGPDEAYRFIQSLEALRRSGEARPYLERLVSAYPTYPTVLHLAGLLLEEGNTERAALCLDTLDKQIKASASNSRQEAVARLWRPAVVALRARLMVAERKSPDDVMKYADKQSLDTPARLAIAQVLIQNNYAPAAEKILLPLAHQELVASTTRPTTQPTTRPADAFPANRLLVYIYNADRRTDDAIKVARDVLRQDPSNETWQNIQFQLTSPEEAQKKIEQRTLEAINAIKDPTRRAVRMYDFLLARNRSAEADKLLTDAYAQSPKDPDVLYRMLNRAFAAKDWPAAEKFAQALGQADYDESGPLYFQASLELAKGEKENALAHATELVGKAGQLSRSWSILGRAQERMGQYDLAIRSFSRALEIQVDSTEAIVGLVRCNLKLGNIDQAKQYVDRGIRLIDPVGLRPLLQNIADAYLRQDRESDAIRTREEALQLDPGNAALRMTLVSAYKDKKRWTDLEKVLNEAEADPLLKKQPDWIVHEIEMWRLRGDANKAEEALNRARKAFPDVPLIETLYLEHLLGKGQLDEVLKLTEKGTAPGQNAPWWRYAARASAFKGLKRDAEASEQFDKAMSAVDTSPEPQALANLTATIAQVMDIDWAKKHLGDRKMPHWSLQLAKRFVAGEDWKNAIPMAEATIQKLNSNPDLAKPEAWMYRLWMLDEVGRIYTSAVAQAVPGAAQRAEQIYLECLKQVQTRQDLNDQSRRDAQFRALNNLACLFADDPKSPDPAKALSYSQQAYDLITQARIYVPGIVDTYAWTLELNGQVDKAIQIYNDMMNRPDVPAEAYYHYAHALLRKKDFDRAEQNLRSARLAAQQAEARDATVDSTLNDKINRLQETIQQQRPAPTTRAAQ